MDSQREGDDRIHSGDENALLVPDMRLMEEDLSEARNGTFYLRRKKTEKSKTQKRKRKNLEKDQVEVLERAFLENTHPSKEEKERLANKVGLSYGKVMKWFDNRRSKMRNSSSSSAAANEARAVKKTRVELPRKEPWQRDVEQRVSSLKASGYISGKKHECNVRGQLGQWLEFMKYRKEKQKKMRKRPKKQKEELFQEFSKEVQRLLTSITFECETLMYQGDGTTTNANISICNFCFSIDDKEAANEINQFPPHKGDVTATVVHDSRVCGVQGGGGNTVATEKIKFKFFKCGHFGEKLSVGVKAVGTPADLLEGTDLEYCAWGDIPKLKEWLHTSLSHAELVAFLFFCTQWKLNAKWFVNCMREKMFPDEDSDYHSESEEFDADDYGDDDDDSDGLD